jgi:Dyp-type peroxidase family
MDAFTAGMAARAGQIGDTRPGDAPTGWEMPFQQKGGVHLLLVIAADSTDELSDRVTEATEKIAACKGEVVFQERGATLPGTLRGHEHFGFRDGSSQPSIDGYGPPPAAGEPPSVPPGEFVFGYPDGTGTATVVDPSLADSSMLVFRRLTQDVAGFRAQAAAGVPGSDPSVSPDQLAAQMVGRWPSGAPIELFPDSDPGDGNAGNAFAYLSADDDGHLCPRWAHVRKANPRDETTPDPSGDTPSRHRMIRRGSPFGRPLPATATADDGHPRGLHFLAVIADAARQFEFVQRQWFNDPNFPGGQPAPSTGGYGPPAQGAPDGPDPLVGEHDDAGAQCVLHQPNGTHPFALNAPVVHVTAGEYFLLPSIALLTTLAKPKP